MMLRLQKKEVTPNTEHAVREISIFIGMLADYYKARNWTADGIPTQEKLDELSLTY